MFNRKLKRQVANLELQIKDLKKPDYVADQFYSGIMGDYVADQFYSGIMGDTWRAPITTRQKFEEMEDQIEKLKGIVAEMVDSYYGDK